MHVKKLSSRQEGEVSVVDVEGAITIGEGANAVRDVLNGLIASNHKKILLNLAEVSFVDSSVAGNWSAPSTRSRRTGAG